MKNQISTPQSPVKTSSHIEKFVEFEIINIPQIPRHEKRTTFGALLQIETAMDSEKRDSSEVNFISN